MEVTEIESGIIYKDDRVTVEAFPVSHGTLESVSYTHLFDFGNYSKEKDEILSQYIIKTQELTKEEK